MVNSQSASRPKSGGNVLNLTKKIDFQLQVNMSYCLTCYLTCLSEECVSLSHKILFACS